MNNFNYYKVFDDNLEIMKTNTNYYEILKQNFCHQSYHNRLQSNDDKYRFYCNFFKLDYDFLKNNIINS
jgi:hypothetical protein